LTVSSIYEPVQAQLYQVEERLEQVVQAAPLPMREQLGHGLMDGGKRIRPALTLLAGRFHNYNLDLLIPMAASMELLHVATLVHDDTVDKSHLRHGKLSINSIWGDSSAVLLGDYLFANSACLAAEPGNLRVVTLFAQTLMTICTGELQETVKPFNESKDYYFQMIGDKTASLFAMATESGAVLSEAPEDVIQSLRGYGYNLGTAFQVVDDILDFTSREEVMGKPVASDLSRGVYTLPVILFLERSKSKEARELLEKDREKGSELLVDMIRQSSVIEECYQVVQTLCDQACAAIEQLPANSAHSSLTRLADYISERKS